MNKSTIKDLRAVATLGAVIWIKAERTRSYAAKAKLVGAEYIRAFADEFGERTKLLGAQWEACQKNKRGKLRQDLVKTMRQNSLNADLNQTEIDAGREIVKAIVKKKK